MLSLKEYLEEKKKDPCWDDYEMVGMKDKNGKKVPNCVPKNEDCGCDHEDDELEEGWKNAVGIGAAVAGLALGSVNAVHNHNAISNLEKTHATMVHKNPEKAAKLKKHIEAAKSTQGNARLQSTTQRHIDAAKKISEEFELEEATYQGREVSLNKPMKGDVKKSKVYVDPDGDGNAQKVNFGDKNMTIKKNIPARRKSFRARHNCDNPGPKDKARYWSCKAW